MEETKYKLKYMVDLACELAGSYEEQYENMEDFARWNLPDETGMEWTDAKDMGLLEEDNDEIPAEALKILQEIHKRFDEAFDDEAVYETVYTHEAMQGHPFWEEQRALAKQVLQMIGYRPEEKEK